MLSSQYKYHNIRINTAINMWGNTGVDIEVVDIEVGGVDIMLSTFTSQWLL